MYIQKFLNSCFSLTLCMNFFTFISHVVSLQFNQPLLLLLLFRGLQVLLGAMSMLYLYCLTKASIRSFHLCIFVLSNLMY